MPVNMRSLCVVGLIFAVWQSCTALALPDTPVSTLENGGQQYAVLVAGSNTWSNYRHQADVCHAYQVLIDHGVPAKNIIVMMYDDIAENEENPTKGQIINRPGGHDVYKGVKIDYKGKHVNPHTFIKVLKGDKEGLVGVGTGRVLESGPNDNVFINFVDHGAPYLIAFPTEELHAKTLMSALTYMHENKMYKQLLFYLEACESGSMFDKLLSPDMNIFATTAANGHESSYAVYFDKKRETYLGDVYSVKWMEDSDVSNLRKETLASQFKKVKRETNTSHVQEYGDLKLAHEPVGDFLGSSPSARNIYYPTIPLDAVPTHNAELHILQHKLKTAESDEEKALVQDQLFATVKYRESITNQMAQIALYAAGQQQVGEVLNTRTDDVDLDCYQAAVEYYSYMCTKINANSYALSQLYVLQNLCNVKEVGMFGIFRAIDKQCA